MRELKRNFLINRKMCLELLTRFEREVVTTTATIRYDDGTSYEFATVDSKIQEKNNQFFIWDGWTISLVEGPLSNDEYKLIKCYYFKEREEYYINNEYLKKLPLIHRSINVNDRASIIGENKYFVTAPVYENGAPYLEGYIVKVNGDEYGIHLVGSVETSREEFINPKKKATESFRYDGKNIVSIRKRTSGEVIATTNLETEETIYHYNRCSLNNGIKPVESEEIKINEQSLIKEKQKRIEG